MNVQALNQVGDAPAVARLRNAITENPAIGGWRRLPEKEGLAAQVLDGAHFAFDHRAGALPDAGQLIAWACSGPSAGRIVQRRASLATSSSPRPSCRFTTPGRQRMVDQVQGRQLGRSLVQIAGVFVAALFGLATAFASPSWADDAADLAALRKQLQELQEKVRSLEAQQPPPAAVGPIERFDGKWEGKIVGDKRYDCRDGELRATVRAGQLEGSRWFFSGNVAPIKGKIKADGSYEGIQNRISTAGRFNEDAAELWYVNPDGSCENKLFMRKVGPL